MTATYNRAGIQFLYPENWAIAQEEQDSIPRTILLQGPSGAFWSLDIHPFSVDASQLLAAVVEAMRGEYAELECHEVVEPVGGFDAEGFDLYFHYLDFVVQAQLRAFRRGHATYCLMYQAEDREFEELHPVFLAITASLLQDK